MSKKTQDKCSFCGRSMPGMFSGEDGTFICQECIELGHRMIQQMLAENGSKADNLKDLNLETLPKPADI